MDDTNPTKEDTEYVDAIKEDIHWLGFDWDDRFFYASQYFDKMYECAEELIKEGLAYVCELTPEQMREYRGDLTTPARSPYRDRPIEESLDLFRRMRAGEFPNGAMTLRAKIDLASGSFNMRDPAIYRINHMPHHATGDKWCIYPMYDFAHPIEDAMEHITHSLCSLEFEAHRPLYNWVVEHCDLPSKPRQIGVCPSWHQLHRDVKRKLRLLVEEGRVSGWTTRVCRRSAACAAGATRRSPSAASASASACRRRPPRSSSAFFGALSARDLNDTAKRAMAVLRPLRLTIQNYPADRQERFLSKTIRPSRAGRPRSPSPARSGSSRTILWRKRSASSSASSPGNEVRLKGAYVVKCTGCRKDENGQVVEVFCEYDPESRGGNPPTDARSNPPCTGSTRPTRSTPRVRLGIPTSSLTPTPTPPTRISSTV